MDLAKYKKKELQQMCFDKGILIKVSDNVENLVEFLKGGRNVNYTEIRCDKNTVDVIKMFIDAHMNYSIHCDTLPQEISKIQDEIRKQIQPYMKKKLDYLKGVTFRNGEFYSVFALIIVIDKIKEYDSWKHINSILYVHYNPANKVSKNKYGVSLIDNYFRPEDVNDAVTLKGIDCCCGKKNIKLINTVGFSNDTHTFILGSFCITKTSIEYGAEKMKKVRENDKMKEDEKERERQEQDRKDKIKQGVVFCISCHKEQPLGTQKWHDICKLCWCLNIRKCKSCTTTFTARWGNLRKCISCYKAEK
jgi:hypothetical protein